MSLRDRLVFDCGALKGKAGCTITEAEKLVATMGDKVGWIKLDQDFFSRGHELAQRVKEMGCRLWLDGINWENSINALKKYATEGAGADMFNVYSASGFEVMRHVKARAEELFSSGLKKKRPLIVAFTILTNLYRSQHEHFSDLDDRVLSLAWLAKHAGLDGVVVSPLEAKIIRKELGYDLLIIASSVRFAEEAKGGQIKVVTPKEAIANGADIVVMGTSLINGGLPAVDRAYKEIEAGLRMRMKSF
ncbi:orotidine 5'-phosphate decarboxylase [Candidatus Falkowbacteria bacterium]|nr:orotidine 5'-phosphate decarboxylase [Candidatus Falkowbacteria bacterium]